MTTPNERKIRAGYDLFLAANPEDDRDWTPDAPVAVLMAEDIHWFDDMNQSGGLRETPLTDRGLVLQRLRELRREMPCCQILSLFEDEAQQVIHTVDHALKLDPESFRGTRPHLCASSFEFDPETGKVKTVRYCSREWPLNSPSPLEASA